MTTVGDRVKFKTNGGWYNSGIIISKYENSSMSCPSCLIEVDTLGYKPSENDPVTLPYYVRVPQNVLIAEYESRTNTLEQYLAPSPDLSFYKRKMEDKNMMNYEWLVKNKAELVKDILSRHLSKEKGIPDYCSETMCRDCDFSCGNCTERIKEWFEQEYEPLYKKGDIVVGPFNQIFFVKKDCNDDGFLMVSSYTDNITDGYKIHVNEIKKKIAHIESEV